MSETEAKYITGSKEFDLEKHIEQELIQGSYNRIRPIIEKAQQTVLAGHI